jgi:hypothetical protein
MYALEAKGEPVAKQSLLFPAHALLSICLTGTLRAFLPSVRCGLLDQSCNLFWPGYVDRVTGAGNFDLVAVGSCGIPPLKIGIDGSVRSC